MADICNRRTISDDDDDDDNDDDVTVDVVFDVAGSSVVNGGSTHQVLSPLAVTTFQVNPNNGQPAIIDPALISQYSGQLNNGVVMYCKKILTRALRERKLRQGCCIVALVSI